MLSYYIYWVTKEHKQNPNRLQETRPPFPICWMCWDCTGAAALHSWEHFAGGLRLLTLGSCLPHSCPHGSVVIRAENYAQKCFFGGVSAEDIKYKQHLQPLQCASWNFSLIQFPQVAKKCH